MGKGCLLGKEGIKRYLSWVDQGQMMSPHCVLPRGLLIFPAEPEDLFFETLEAELSALTLLAVLNLNLLGIFHCLHEGGGGGCFLPRLIPRAQNRVVYGFALPASHPTTLAPREPFGKSEPRAQEIGLFLQL